MDFLLKTMYRECQKSNELMKLFLFKSSSSSSLSLSLSLYIYIYIYIYVVPSISFQTFFVWAFKIVVDNSVCYCYTSYEMTDQIL